MGHHLAKSGYPALVERLNRYPQGAPESALLYRILALLFSEKEAGLVALLPLKPFTAAAAAAAWKLPGAEARRLLDGLAGRALLLDTVVPGGETTYVLPPPMAGFFEFALMRTRGDIDQKALSGLLYQYLNVEEDFIRGLFAPGETQLGRVFVQEPALPPGGLHVLDYERASEVIRTASRRGVGLCYCRHKMRHLGKACGAPLEICMTFNGAADSLVRHGFAREAGVPEMLDLLRQAYELRLVQFGENVREGVNFICNCCGCCCEAMQAARRFSFLHPVHTTNFMPETDEERCTGCGLCARVCPVAAVRLKEDPARPGRKTAAADPGLCLGCGVCARSCVSGAVRLAARGRRVLTPLNTAHRVVLMAIERGKLQDLIFDNRALFSHRAMAAILGVILKLPPVKRALAGRQLRSRYLETLIRRLAPKAAPAGRDPRARS